MIVISLRNLSKKYPIYARPSDKLKEMLTLGRRRYHQEFWALEDINLDVESGTTLGIIGQNGSGKSTLLQIIAGILRQTRGDCFVRGRVAALLELGAGFNPEFTGRENVYISGAIMGLGQKEMERRFDQIANFAEIGDFIDQPVKTYSSGMFMRLAFAVAINVDPDILLVDEALAVGDLVFQHRCMHRINQLRSAGKTILFVTHDLSAVTRFCDRAILLDGGHLIADGRPDLVVQKYIELVFERQRRYQASQGAEIKSEPQGVSSKAEWEIEPVCSVPNIDHRFGNGKARVIGVELLNADLKPTRRVAARETVIVRVSALCCERIERPIVGFTLRDRLGVQVSASNTSYEGRFLPPAAAGDLITADFAIELPPIAPGSYSISPAVAEGSVLDHDMCDWIDNALVFELENTELIYGLMRLPVRIRYAITHS